MASSPVAIVKSTQIWQEHKAATETKVSIRDARKSIRAGQLEVDEWRPGRVSSGGIMGENASITKPCIFKRANQNESPSTISIQEPEIHATP
jgi:hypothetical protein